MAVKAEKFKGIFQIAIISANVAELDGKIRVVIENKEQRISVLMDPGAFAEALCNRPQECEYEVLTFEKRVKKLSAQQRQMLEMLKDGPHLAGTWDFSGSRVPAQLIRLGLVARCDHPTVVDRKWDRPADAYELTDAGREALKSAEQATGRG